MSASSCGHFNCTPMTPLERGIIFLSYCYPGKIIYDDACHLKEFCVNPLRKEVTGVPKKLGKMDVVVDKLHFRNHADRWGKANCNPHDQNQLHGVSICLSVYRYRFAIFVFVFVSFCFALLFFFFSFLSFFRGGGAGGSEWEHDCKGNRRNSNNRSMWWP